VNQHEATVSDPRDAVIARICARAWSGSAPTVARLRDAGFGPDRWPDWAGLASVAPLDKRDIPALQRAAPPLGGLDAPREGAGCLFLSAGGFMEPDMPAAEARLADFFRASGLNADDVVLNGFSYHLTPAGLLFHNALLRVGCRVLPGGPQNTEQVLELAHRGRATAFTGISGHLKFLVDRAMQTGLRIGEAIPLRIAFAGGEPFGGPIREELTTRFGIACFDYYGTADLGVVAGERADAEGLELLPGVVAEVLDIATGARLPDGETGHLVLSVDNPNYPMLRLATGDLAALAPGAPRRMLGPFGRVDASARVRGLLLHEAQVRRALAAHPAISAGYVEVSRVDGRDLLAAALVIAADGAFPAADAAFRARFPELCRLSLDSVHQVAEAAGPLVRDLRPHAEKRA